MLGPPRAATCAATSSCCLSKHSDGSRTGPHLGLFCWMDREEGVSKGAHQLSSEHTSLYQRKSLLLWKLPMRGGRIRIGLCRWRCQWGPPTPTPTRRCPLFRPPLFLHLQNQKLTRRLRHSRFYGSELNLQQIYRGFIISFSVYRLEDVILDLIL